MRATPHGTDVPRIRLGYAECVTPRAATLN
jgi:hypothetical protein